MDELTIQHDPKYIYQAARVPLKPRKLPRLRERSPYAANVPIIEASSMRDIFSADFEHFARIPGAQLREKGKRKHIFIDRGSNVLGVAHLDTVKQATHFWMNNLVAASPVVDNRMGAWVIMQGLPSMGFAPDILLTDGEEKGQSTAEDFVPDKEYNWIFSFDRTGEDVACYGYLDEAWKLELSKYKLVGVEGLNSDIAYMESLGIKGMNVGCGMYDYHSEYAFVRMTELRAQMARFVDFCKENWETKFTHTPKPKPTYKVTRYRQGGFDEYGEYYDKNYAGYKSLTERKAYDKTTAKTIMAEIAREDVTLSMWWLLHSNDEMKGENKTYCTTCDSYFRYKDTWYSHTRHKLFCGACFILEMLPARVLNDDEYIEFITGLGTESKLDVVTEV